MFHRVPVFLVLIALFPSAPAGADWIISPHIGLKFGADVAPQALDFERSVDEQATTWGGSAGLLGAGVLGVEADFGWVIGFFDGKLKPRGDVVTSSRVITLMGNVIVAAPLEMTQYGLRPYASGGLGLLHGSSRGVGGILAARSNLLGMNAGGGVIGPVTPRSSVRLDLRYFRSISGADEAAETESWSELSFWRASIGLTFRY